ncbi:MAG: hypothetical protein DRO52_05870 [Candidatus Hecatellales archaeon]|nr:MAG: hypothetical protein DRO52_05870 [Candidatus Hecatellales archaeon]
MVADSAALADAAAKAVCIAVMGGDVGEALRKGLERAGEIEGVRGALIIYGEHLATFGKLPKIVKLEGGPSEVLRAALHIQA